MTNSRNRKLIHVTSSNECWGQRASILVPITDIWTRFGTQLKHHTVNIMKNANSPNLKIPFSTKDAQRLPATFLTSQCFVQNPSHDRTTVFVRNVSWLGTLDTNRYIYIIICFTACTCVTSLWFTRISDQWIFLQFVLHLIVFAPPRATIWWKNYNNMLSRFHPMPERYGQMDRQTDRQTGFNIARQYADTR